MEAQTRFPYSPLRPAVHNFTGRREIGETRVTVPVLTKLAQSAEYPSVRAKAAETFAELSLTQQKAAD